MTALGDYLKGRGFAVNDSDVPLGRESAWDRVEWIIVHHTADTCDPAQADARARYIKTADGRYPPLAQIMLGRNGKVYVCCRPRDGQAEPGRASHAGEGSYPGIPTDAANQVALGVEVQCSGKHSLAHHADTYAVLLDLLTALQDRYDVPVDHVIGHKEYSSTGKIDPRDDMDELRADVGAGKDDPVEYLSLGMDAGNPLPLPVDTWTLVTWPNEFDDDWKGHAPGYGRVDLPAKGLVWGGVVLAADVALDARVSRGPAADGPGSATRLSGTSAPPGVFVLSVPPALAADQALWVEVRPHSDDGHLIDAALRLVHADRKGH